MAPVFQEGIVDKSVTERSSKKSVEEIAREVAIGRRDGLDATVRMHVFWHFDAPRLPESVGWVDMAA